MQGADMPYRLKKDSFIKINIFESGQPLQKVPNVLL